MKTKQTTIVVGPGARFVDKKLAVAAGAASEFRGTFQKRRTGVLFETKDGKPFAFLVANRHGERFFVTCSRQEDGRIRYMFSLCSLDARVLGFEGESYTQERDVAQRVWGELSAA